MPATEERLALAAEVRRLKEADPTLRWSDIANELGISRNYVSDLYNDPHGEKARARKDGYRRPCPDCGKLMSGHAGKNVGPDHCADCAKKYRKFWTREKVIAAFQEFNQRYGRPPAVTDIAYRYPTIRVKLSDARIAEAESVQDNNLPTSVTTVVALFGSWSNAREVAGLGPSTGGGEPTHRAAHRDQVARDNQILEAIRAGFDTVNGVSAYTGRSTLSLSTRLSTLTERGILTREQTRGRGRPYRYLVAD